MKTDKRIQFLARTMKTARLVSYVLLQSIRGISNEMSLKHYGLRSCNQPTSITHQNTLSLERTECSMR